MVTLAKGTTEYLVVKLTDLLKNLTDLDNLPAAPTFKVYKTGTQTPEIATGTCQVDGPKMLALALVNTTGWEETEYNLFLYFSLPPEAPRLGPFPFRVED